MCIMIIKKYKFTATTWQKRGQNMKSIYSTKEDFLKKIEKAIEVQKDLILSYEELVAGDFISDAVLKNIEFISIQAIKDLENQASLFNR